MEAHPVKPLYCAWAADVASFRAGSMSNGPR